MGLQAPPLDVGVQNHEGQEIHSFELLRRPKMDAGVWKQKNYNYNRYFWSYSIDNHKGPIIYFIEGRSPSRDKQVLHVAGTLMEYFLVLLRLWQVNSEEKICICYSSHLVWVKMYQCLNEVIPSWKCSIKAPDN